MNKQLYNEGEVIKRPNGDYAKVIYHKNGVYGLSDWSRRSIAEMSTVAVEHVPQHKLLYFNARPIERDLEEDDYTRTELRNMTTDELYPIAEDYDVDTEQNKPDVLEDLFSVMEI